MIGVEPRIELSGVVDVDCVIEGMSDSSPDKFAEVEAAGWMSGAL